MEQITFNPNNEPYYSDDFIKGFKCGAERQLEADKKDRPQGEWLIEKTIYDNYNYRCNNCDWYETHAYIDCETYNFCPNCGADMR